MKRECNLGGDNTLCKECAYYPEYEWSEPDEACMTRGKNLYKVPFWYVVHCNTEQRADSLEEAEERVKARLSYFGMEQNEHGEKFQYEEFDRDYGTCCASEIKEE